MRSAAVMAVPLGGRPRDFEGCFRLEEDMNIIVTRYDKGGNLPPLGCPVVVAILVANARVGAGDAGGHGRGLAGDATVSRLAYKLTVVVA